jgi:CRISPR-associated protein Cas1
MHNLYLNSSGTLSRADHSLAFQTGSRNIAYPVEATEAIYLFGETSLNTKLLNFCGQKKIPIHVFNHFGNHTGTFLPHGEQVSGTLVIRQVKAYQTKERRLNICRNLIATAGFNMASNLSKSIRAAAEAAQIENLLERIDSAGSPEEIMGIEGHMRRIYYNRWQDWMGLEDAFTRDYAPPSNPINALLSFLNSLLYATVVSEIYRTGLYPGISYLHSPQERRFSLALDLSEITKPVIVDRMLARMINTKAISDADFIKDSNGILLKEESRKRVIEEWDGQIKTTVYYRHLKRNCSYRQIIRRDCYQLIRHLLEDEPLNFFRRH